MPATLDRCAAGKAMTADPKDRRIEELEATVEALTLAIGKASARLEDRPDATMILNAALMLKDYQYRKATHLPRALLLAKAEAFREAAKELCVDCGQGDVPRLRTLSERDGTEVVWRHGEGNASLRCRAAVFLNRAAALEREAGK